MSLARRNLPSASWNRVPSAPADPATPGGAKRWSRSNPSELAPPAAMERGFSSASRSSRVASVREDRDVAVRARRRNLEQRGGWTTGRAGPRHDRGPTGSAGGAPPRARPPRQAPCRCARSPRPRRARSPQGRAAGYAPGSRAPPPWTRRRAPPRCRCAAAPPASARRPARGSARPSSTSSGVSSRWISTLPSPTSRRRLLEGQPLVQRVLVDDLEAVGQGAHEIGLRHLQVGTAQIVDRACQPASARTATGVLRVPQQALRAHPAPQSPRPWSPRTTPRRESRATIPAGDASRGINPSPRATARPSAPDREAVRRLPPPAHADAGSRPSTHPASPCPSA